MGLLRLSTLIFLKEVIVEKVVIQGQEQKATLGKRLVEGRAVEAKADQPGVWIRSLVYWSLAR